MESVTCFKLAGNRMFPATLLLILLSITQTASADELASQGWKVKTFSGSTRYTLETYGTKTAIRGETNGGASALYKKKKVNINNTPILRWQWKVSNVYDGINEKSKGGDDFPARIYVVYKKGMMPWNTVAINYVWSSTQPVGANWPSPYTDKSRVVVVESGDGNIEQWVQEEANIAADFHKYFGLDVSKIDGYAVMVDGDNSGQSNVGWFQNISFAGTED